MSHIVKKKWDEKTRLEAVQAYILTGSLALAAAMCKVPLPTAKVWKTSQWFKDLELELRQGAKLRLSSRLSKIVDKSIDALEDRLDKGDFMSQYNKEKKQHEWVRRPITAEVAQKITAQLIDRTLLVEKAAQTGVVTDEGLDARLEKLRQEMKDFAKRPSLKPPEREIIDVIPQLVEESVPEPQTEVPKERPIRIAGSRPTPDPSYRQPGSRPDRDPATLPADSSLRVVLG